MMLNNEIEQKIALIIRQIQYKSSDTYFEEECPISIVSMDAWEWPQGVALYALFQYAKAAHEIEMMQWLNDWFEQRIEEGLPAKNVNTTCPMLAMTALYTQTHNEKFLTLINEWAEYAMNKAPRVEEAGFQHVVSGGKNEGQLWDDTLYMQVLFLALAGKVLHRPAYIQESIRQFLVHIKYLADPKTSLFFHGYSFIRRDHFAGALWARGNSWYTAGLVDYLEILGESCPVGVKEFLIGTLQSQVQALIGCQSVEGRWHTLLDDSTSYLETSASCAITYGILKAIRKGYLTEDVAVIAHRALVANVAQIDNQGVVQGVSYGTPVFDNLQQYREVAVCAMPYGQSMALLMLVESLFAKGATDANT